MPKPVGKKKRLEEAAALAAAAESLRLIEEASSGFKALGDPTRLRIVLFLRAATAAPFDKGENDLLTAADSAAGAITVGDVALHLTGSDKVSSNISHHLKELRHAGLIGMKRRGKNILCRVEEEALGRLETMLCSQSSSVLRPPLAAASDTENSGKAAPKPPSKKRQSKEAEAESAPDSAESSESQEQE